MKELIFDYVASGAKLELVSIVIAAILPIIISYTLGKKRYIGLEWSFLLCFGFSMVNGVALLFGLLMTYNSPLKELPKPKYTRIRLWIGIFLILFSVISLIGLTEKIDSNTDLNIVKTGLALLILGMYLIYSYSLNRRK